MDRDEEPEIIALGEIPIRHEPTQRNFVEPNLMPQRHMQPSQARNRHHPYRPSVSSEERRPESPNTRPDTMNRSGGGSNHINRLFATPLSRPIADDDGSILVVGEIQHNLLRTSGPPPQEFQRPMASPSPRIPYSNMSATNAPPIPTNFPRPPSPPNYCNRRHVPFTTISPTPRCSSTTCPDNSQVYQTGWSTPIPVASKQSLRRTVSVGIQTSEEIDLTEKGRSESAKPSTSKSTSLSEPSETEDKVEILFKTFMSTLEAQFRGRMEKNFKPKNEADLKKLTKALINANKGIKADRSSTREVMEFLAVIDPKNFPYEIDRLWNKDLEKVAYMEKERTLKLMVEELNEIEKKLVTLDVHIKEKTITEAEQIEYDNYASELAKKYFKYQKYLGSDCAIRGYIYATQTQKFDFSTFTTSTLPAVQHALEEAINAKLEEFLKCMTDVDSIFIPLFSEVEEIVNTVMKSHHFENTQEENFKIAEGFYKELVKEKKHRRMNDLWRSLLFTIRCPTVEALEQSDPADKSPALASRLAHNDEIGGRRFHELFAEYSTDENNDSDMDAEQLEEDAMDLQDFIGVDNTEDSEQEADREFVEADAVVPIQGDKDFATIWEQMQQMNYGSESSSFEASSLRFN